MTSETPGSGSVSIGGASASAAGADAPAQPASTVSHDEQTKSHPAGSAMPSGGIPVTERPEALIGGAFAGGFLFALILKKLGR